MKNSISKLIVFGAILFIASMSSCKTGGGYGCDYTESSKQKELESNDENPQMKTTYKYTAVSNVTD